MILNFCRRLSVWSLIVQCCSLAATLPQPEPTPESNTSTPSECALKPKPELIGISHTEGKGLGYSQGYSSLSLFLSQPFSQKSCLYFLDLRGHLFNNGKYAANAGTGFRWMNKRRSRIFGVNGFYDYLQTAQRPYNQVSLGFEALWQGWGMFVNGYLPVGRKETPLYQFSYLSTSPGNFLVEGTEKFAMKGIDAEIGYRFCDMTCLNIYTGIGPYGYWGRSTATKNAFRPAHRHAVGGRFSASISYRQYVCLQGVATYDSLFKWGGQVMLVLAFPFDLTFKTKGRQASPCFQERLYQLVHRNEIIVIDHIHRFSSDPAILDPENKP
jgi:hypothetical protein